MRRDLSSVKKKCHSNLPDEVMSILGCSSGLCLLSQFGLCLWFKLSFFRGAFHALLRRTMATMASLSAACGFFAAGLVLCRRRRRGKALSDKDVSGPDISGSARRSLKFTCLHRDSLSFFLEFFHLIAGVEKNPKMWDLFFSVPMETTMVETPGNISTSASQNDLQSFKTQDHQRTGVRSGCFACCWSHHECNTTCFFP